MVQRRLVAAKNNVIEQATFCRFLLHFAHHIILVLDRAFKDFQIGLQRPAAIITPIVDTCCIVFGYLSGPGVDCGFGTFAGYSLVADDVVWAKLQALSDGAALASKRLWS